MRFENDVYVKMFHMKPVELVTTVKYLSEAA